MSGAQNLSDSAAVLRSRYQDGVPPALLYKAFKYLSMVQVREDHKDDKLYVPVQTERPQGSGTTVQEAQGSLQGAKYLRFAVDRVEHFGIARIKGQALRVAEGKGSGALLDLWSNEVDGAMQTEMMETEIFAAGNGSGVLARIASGQTTSTITLTRAADGAKLCVGQRIACVSDNTLSPTVRSGFAIITSIVRDLTTCTVSFAAALNTYIGTVAANDYIVRYSNQAISGTRMVVTGWQQLCEGGTSPSAVHGLTRTSDPVRLAGQTKDYTGAQIEDAMVDMLARIASQGGETGSLTAGMHPRTWAKWKKQLHGRITYPRVDVKSERAESSFRTIRFEGDEGDVTLFTSPFWDIDEITLMPLENTWLAGAGPSHSIQYYNEAGKDIVVPTDDAAEVRLVSYHDHYTNRPVDAFRGTGFNPDA